MRFSHLAIQPSKKLTRLLVFMHLGAMLCIGLSTSPLWLQLLAYSINFYSAYINIKRHSLLQHPLAIREIWTNATGEWYLRAQNGKVYTVHLQGDTLLTSSLVILNFKRSDSRFGISVILFPDAVETTTFRRMRSYTKNNTTNIDI